MRRSVGSAPPVPLTKESFGGICAAARVELPGTSRSKVWSPSLEDWSLSPEVGPTSPACSCGVGPRALSAANRLAGSPPASDPCTGWGGGMRRSVGSAPPVPLTKESFGGICAAARVELPGTSKVWSPSPEDWSLSPEVGPTSPACSCGVGPRALSAANRLTGNPSASGSCTDWGGGIRRSAGSGPPVPFSKESCGGICAAARVELPGTSKVWSPSPEDWSLSPEDWPPSPKGWSLSPEVGPTSPACSCGADPGAVPTADRLVGSPPASGSCTGGGGVCHPTESAPPAPFSKESFGGICAAASVELPGTSRSRVWSPSLEDWSLSPEVGATSPACSCRVGPRAVSAANRLAGSPLASELCTGWGGGVCRPTESAPPVPFSKESCGGIRAAARVELPNTSRVWSPSLSPEVGPTSPACSCGAGPRALSAANRLAGNPPASDPCTGWGGGIRRSAGSGPPVPFSKESSGGICAAARVELPGTSRSRVWSPSLSPEVGPTSPACSCGAGPRSLSAANRLAGNPPASDPCTGWGEGMRGSVGSAPPVTFSKESCGGICAAASVELPNTSRVWSPSPKGWSPSLEGWSLSPDVAPTSPAWSCGAGPRALSAANRLAGSPPASGSCTDWGGGIRRSAGSGLPVPFSKESCGGIRAAARVELPGTSRVWSPSPKGWAPSLEGWSLSPEVGPTSPACSCGAGPGALSAANRLAGSLPASGSCTDWGGTIRRSAGSGPPVPFSKESCGGIRAAARVELPNTSRGWSPSPEGWSPSQEG
jgi:hypothetical protein